MKNRMISPGVCLVFLASALSGCDALSKYVPQARQWLSQKEAVKTVPVAIVSAAPSGDPEGVTPEQAAANAERMQEIFSVVFVRAPQDRAEFASYVDSLNQGASLEGIYNGLVHSADYRSLEQGHPGASPEALRAFAEELTLLELQLPHPTAFSASAAQPLATPVDPALAADQGATAEPSQSLSPSPLPTQAKALAEHYLQQFSQASFYTLKRILGDEALKVIEAKRPVRNDLAAWYSTWAVRISHREIDFGVALRNKADAKLHLDWALGASQDKLTWEVLNRLHRTVNELNKKGKGP